jgi:hypothetical protein
MPRQVSADGGFASKGDLAFAKERGIKDTVFAGKRGLAVLDMAKSNRAYKKLRNFRAGIEAGISVIKRAFGLEQHRLPQPPGHGEDQAGIGLIGDDKERTNQGRYCQGRTPMQALTDDLPLYQKYVCEEVEEKGGGTV